MTRESLLMVRRTKARDLQWFETGVREQKERPQTRGPISQSLTRLGGHRQTFSRLNVDSISLMRRVLVLILAALLIAPILAQQSHRRFNDASDWWSLLRTDERL